MLRKDFIHPASGQGEDAGTRPTIQIVAFLSPYSNCWAYHDLTRVLDEEAAKKIPPQTGMGICGFRILTVYMDEWLDNNEKLTNLETRKSLTVLSEGPRHLYRSRVTGSSYMKPDLIEGDVLVDDDGKNPETIKPLPKISEVAAQLAARPS